MFEVSFSMLQNLIVFTQSPDQLEIENSNKKRITLLQQVSFLFLPKITTNDCPSETVLILRRGRYGV